MQLGFYFDQNRCTGCFACAIACKDWHDVPAGPARWLRLLYQEEGDFPNVYVSHMATPCYHCTEPVCAFVCPNEAVTKRDEDGIVVVDRDKCRGDQTCGIMVGEGPEALYGEQDAPCQTSCPAHLHIPAYVALIAKGKFKESLDLIRRRMPLPSVCGRVCMHPCETECRRKEVEEPIAIMALKGFVTDNVPLELPARLPRTQPNSVAIVGSGPAGLAAAYDLIRLGYGVSVFESGPTAGGMLVTGVPEHRLPRDVLKRDIDYLGALGIDIRTNTPVDLGAGIDGLLQNDYGAVLLALGAGRGQKLPIPGADLEGTTTGTEFMKAVNSASPPAVGDRVLVVGGGNVAIDCARSARRLGAGTVHVACLEGRDDMPAEESEIAQAIEEGVQLHCSRTFSQVDGQGGRVAGVECQEIEGLVFDETGRPGFTVIQGTGHTLEADTVVFAVGPTPDVSGLAGGVSTAAAGTVVTDPETSMTGRRGVFAAGDAVSGPTNAVEAIASGQRAAFFINRFLQGDVVPVRPEPEPNAADVKVEIPPEKQEKKPREAMPLRPLAERLAGFSEVALGYAEEAAIREAERCLNCAGHLCKDACPYSVPQFADEEKAKMQKCDLCIERWPEGKKPICVEACPPHAMDAGDIEAMRAKYGGVTEAGGFVYSEVAQPSLVTSPKPRNLGR
jgi:NADPH-dependent glutamate synthase beta subunit-like oxidoreductase